MRKLAVVILLLCSALAWAGGEPTPADYTINVHVSSSRLTDISELRLIVIIDGKKYELQGVTTNALLAPGDYRAKLVKDEHKTAYDSYRIYEFLFPDRKTRQYHLVGVTE
jgi:hypothetical protein